MNLKALREKRARLVNELDTMLVALENEGEIRSLTNEEKEAFDGKKAEIVSIDETIARVEELRANAMGDEEVVKLDEKRNNEDAEKRAIEKYFRGEMLDAEERAMVSTVNGGALLPTTINKTIMQKLVEQCPVLDKAKRFNTKGTLRLIKEDSIGTAQITAENGAFNVNDATFKTIELKAFKIATAVQISFEMLSNTDIDLAGYLSEIVITRLSRELNKLFVVGTGVNQPQGLVNGTKTYTLASADTVAITDFIKMQTSVNPSYINGSVWIMSRPVFQLCASMLDGQGRPFLTTHVINEKIQYRLLGLEVIVDENMDEMGTDNKVVIMANLSECYAINMIEDITVRHLTEKGFTQGYEEYASYVMADGRIINEDAMVVGVCA